MTHPFLFWSATSCGLLMFGLFLYAVGSSITEKGFKIDLKTDNIFKSIGQGIILLCYVFFAFSACMLLFFELFGVI